MSKRIDPEDTVDNATHFLHRLQADGWGIESMETEISYGQTSPKAKKIPTRATVTIRLIPSRP